MTNLIVIMVDQMRADVAYHEKYSFVQLPHLDRLRQESVSFEQAYCNYPVCGPSRAAIYTGRYPQQTGVMNNRCMLPADERTLGHHLADNGYDVVAFGKTHGQNPGFRRIPEPPIETSLGSSMWGWYKSQSMLDASTSQHNNVEPIMRNFGKSNDNHYDYIVANQVKEYLSNRDASQPFALHIGIHTPHPPLIPPEDVAGMYEHQSIELHHVSGDMAQSKPQMQRATGEEFRKTPLPVREQMMRTYLELHTHVDNVLGHLLTLFHNANIMDETIIIFISDHGEQMGEFEMLGKFNNFYDASLRVPLIIRLPDKMNANSCAKTLIELVDLYPTICQLLGVTLPARLAGQSFVPILDNPYNEHRDFVHAMIMEKGAHGVHSNSSKSPFDAGYMIRSQEFKLNIYASDKGELYDMQNDRQERNNLYHNPDYQTVKMHLLEQMMKHNIKYRRTPTLWGYNHFPG